LSHVHQSPELIHGSAKKSISGATRAVAAQPLKSPPLRGWHAPARWRVLRLADGPGELHRTQIGKLELQKYA